MPPALKTQIVGAVTSRAIPAPVYQVVASPAPSAPAADPVPTNQASIDSARRDRVYIAVFLSLASPDYLIQK
jgi:hypothetical protein